MDYLAKNKALWDSWTNLHVSSGFYGVERFKAGDSTLRFVEQDALGDVSGKRLLHLQCHFGLDTLSLARMGARVTGVDLSSEAVSAARALAEESDLEGEFIESDILALEGRWRNEFDIVFTSYGTICWLRELDTWARIIAESLKPGGFFYMVDTHPLVMMLDEEGRRLEHSYFNRGRMIEIQEKGSYAMPDADFEAPSYTFSHSLSETVGPLLRAGLSLTRLEEFDFHTQDCFSFVEEKEPGKFVVRQDALEANQGTPLPDMPLMFDLKAEKPV